MYADLQLEQMHDGDQPASLRRAKVAMPTRVQCLYKWQPIIFFVGRLFWTWRYKATMSASGHALKALADLAHINLSGLRFRVVDAKDQVLQLTSPD